MEIMDYNEYNYKVSKIEYAKSVEEIINTHKSLIGKSSRIVNYQVNDLGMSFINKILSLNWGRSIVYEYNQPLIEFINSKYLSDYIKAEIGKLLEIMDEPTALNIIKSNKNINDFTEEEIKEIYMALNKILGEKPLIQAFNRLLYLLSGNGIVSFINNHIKKSTLARKILLTSGLSDRASYYSGRGVNYGDLSDKNLVSIFEKLLKYDKSYAINFIELVVNMNSLGATEFINTFLNFAQNGFKYSSLVIDKSNIDLGSNHEMTEVLAIASMASAFNRESGNDQYYLTDTIKYNFLGAVKTCHPEISTTYPNEKFPRARKRKDYDSK